MRKGIFVGKTKEEAIESGLKELKTKLDRVKVEIIEEEKKGLLFGIGSKEAKIEMFILDDPIAEAYEFLNDVFTALGHSYTIEQSQSTDGILFNIVGDELGILIGRRGQTLDALQYLLNIVANRYGEKQERFILDAENFRDRRKKTLQQLSTRIANQVMKSKRPVTLEPMTSLERKIIHMHLQDHPKVKTSSEGEDLNRHIIISLR
jgi:spoIIIJ-associated protein